MSHHIISLKPLFLTEDEALALLDMSLMSSADNNPTKESALLKLTDLVRRYLTAAENTLEGAPVTEENPSETECYFLPTMSRLPTSLEPGLMSEGIRGFKRGEPTNRSYGGRRKRCPLSRVHAG